jgi:hypothetical protein
MGHETGEEGKHCGDVVMEESFVSSAAGSGPPVAPCNITFERNAIGTSHNAPEINIPTHLVIGW